VFLFLGVCSLFLALLLRLALSSFEYSLGKHAMDIKHRFITDMPPNSNVSVRLEGRAEGVQGRLSTILMPRILSMSTSQSTTCSLSRDAWYRQEEPFIASNQSAQDNLVRPSLTTCEIECFFALLDNFFPDPGGAGCPHRRKVGLLPAV
jgi:hypothetical protein